MRTFNLFARLLEPIRITVAHVMLSAAKHLSSAVNARFFAALRMTTPCDCGYSDRHLVMFLPYGIWPVVSIQRGFFSAVRADSCDPMEP